jgi:hypothetical protein
LYQLFCQTPEPTIEAVLRTGSTVGSAKASTAAWLTA